MHQAGDPAESGSLLAYLPFFFSALAAFFSLRVLVGAFFFSLRASLVFMAGGSERKWAGPSGEPPGPVAHGVGWKVKESNRIAHSRATFLAGAPPRPDPVQALASATKMVWEFLRAWG